MFSRVKSSRRAPEKNVTKNPTKNFSEEWAKVQGGIAKLLLFIGSDMKRPFDFSEYSLLYTTVYDLCTNRVDMGDSRQPGPATDRIYEEYQRTFNTYLTEDVVPSLKEKQGETLMMEAVKKWRDHQLVVKWMRRLFTYLDQYYTKHSNKDSLQVVGIKAFQQLVYGSIRTDMARALLDKIQQEREGELIDRSVMKDGIFLFIEMGLGTLKAYEADFEAGLLTETQAFYRRESARWIAEDSCPDYMVKVEERVQQEVQRARAYLHETSEPNLIRVVDIELISSHMATLLDMPNSGFVPLLRDYKEDDLSRMYRLFARVANLKPMSEKFRDYVTQEGLGILRSHEQKEELDVNAFVDELLAMQDKYELLVNQHFKKEHLFLQAMKDAFTTFVNKEITHVKATMAQHMTELLSTYVDNLMRNIRIEEEELDKKLENVVKLFGYIGEKDMFQEFYRRQLSKRLLVFGKLNLDAEKNFITKLKMRQGASFTSKLEGMITDKRLSEDLQRQFKEYTKGRKEAQLEVDFSPQVLTTGFWPSGFKVDQITVPPAMQTCIDVFKRFYDSRTQSRILKWVHSLGTATVVGRFSHGNRDIQCSTYQACVLLAFNDTPSLSAADIQKTLSLPMEDVQRAIISLAFGKYKILTKTSSKEKGVNPTDVFAVNTAFKDRAMRIKIKNVVFEMDDSSRLKVQETTQDDRKHSIEASVVRIMKARKVLDHQTLVLEVSKQLMTHFSPDPRLIKRRIEDLIAREYLERDPERTNVYKYLA